MAALPDLALHLSNHGSARTVLDRAVSAERAGVRTVWLSEDLFHRGAVATAGAVLAATHELTVGFGVLVPHTRHPASLAMETRSLLDLGPGRVLLGLGAGVADRTRLVGKDAGTPLVVVREALEAVRTLLAGGELSQAGALHDSTGLRLTGEPPQTVPPVYVAAVGPRALAQAGRLADGVVLTLMCSLEHARWACRQVADAAETAGRPCPPVVAYLPVAIGDDAQRARSRMRAFIADYVARWADLAVLSTLFTRWSSLDEAVVARIRDTVRAGQDASGLVPDDVLDAYAASGTPEQIRRTLRAFAEAGVTTVAVDPVDDPEPDAAGATVQRWSELVDD